MFYYFIKVNYIKTQTSFLGKGYQLIVFLCYGDPIMMAVEYSLHSDNFAVRKMCDNELNIVDSFSVMLGWVEPALSKKWLCLLVLSADNLCEQFRSRSDPNKKSDLCFPL